jgi:hypothetical protein
MVYFFFLVMISLLDAFFLFLVFKPFAYKPFLERG